MPMTCSDRLKLNQMLEASREVRPEAWLTFKLGTLVSISRIIEDAERRTLRKAIKAKEKFDAEYEGGR